MTVFQRTDHLTSSSEPAGPSEVCQVTKEGARGGWLLSKVADFVCVGLKKEALEYEHSSAASIQPW